MGFVNVPNNITIFRIVLTPVFISLLAYYSPDRPQYISWAIAVFVLACLTDALDGFIARRFNQKTSFGSYIDPIADKILLVSGYICLSLMPNLPGEIRVPIWLSAFVITRDVIILMGSVIIFMTTGSIRATPSKTGKWTTFLQMTTLILSLFGVATSTRNLFFIAAAIFTLISGIQYVRLGERIVR